MTDTFKTIYFALIVGVSAATCALHRLPHNLRTSQLLLVGQTGQERAFLGADGQGKIGLGFYDQNGRPHELGDLDLPDDADTGLKFWGLQITHGDDLTTIGVYSDRDAKYVAPVLDNFGLPPRFE